MKSDKPLPNIGPKSAAWLRQVGLHTRDDLEAVGPIEAYARIRRAGFKASLNLVYALEGALIGCHWQKLDPARRAQLAVEAEAALAAAQPSAGLPAQVTEMPFAAPEAALAPTLRLNDPAE